MSSLAVRLCLPVAFLLALTGCSGVEATPSLSNQSAVIDTAAPSTENTTAVEKPLPPRGGNPAITVASLPVGGSDLTGGPCVQVSWSGNAIPEGLAAKITGVAFESHTYEQTDHSCPGPQCIGHLFRTSDRSCDLAVTPTDSRATGRNPDAPVNVSMSGQVLCTDYGAAPCKTFEGAVRGQGGSLTVARPIVPQDSGTGGAGAPPPTTTAGSGG